MSGKNAASDNKAYTILSEAAKKGGHSTDGPYFWEEELKIFQAKIAADKIPTEFKKPPKIGIPNETEFIENRDDVFKRER